MSPDGLEWYKVQTSFPRSRGDEPHYNACDIANVVFSPLTRG